MVTGHNRLLNAAGVDTTYRMQILHVDRTETGLGTNNAASAGGYGSVNYLESYGAHV